MLPLLFAMAEKLMETGRVVWPGGVFPSEDSLAAFAQEV
jgi:hypothetical protein